MGMNPCEMLLPIVKSFMLHPQQDEYLACGEAVLVVRKGVMPISGPLVNGYCGFGAVFGFARRSTTVIGYSVDRCLCDDAFHLPGDNISRVVRLTQDPNGCDYGRPSMGSRTCLRVGAIHSLRDCNASYRGPRGRVPWIFIGPNLRTAGLCKPRPREEMVVKPELTTANSDGEQYWN